MRTSTPNIDMRAAFAPRFRWLAAQPSLLIVVGLVVLPFVLFGAATLGRQVFYYHDLQYYFYPYHTLVADVLWQGRLPLWNPYAFSGIPLLGDLQTAIFYPPNWLFLVLPGTLALNYAILTQLSIAGAGMFVFARSLTLGHSAATLAALAYMFNGFIATRMVQVMVIGGAALLPLVFWSVDRLRQHPGRRTFAVAACMVALQWLAGHPQLPVYTALALALYLVVRELAERQAARTRRVVRAVGLLAAVCAAGLCFAAIQVLPWLDFARFSPRAAHASFKFVAGDSLVGIDWLLMLMPYIFGGVDTSIWHPGRPNLPYAIYVWERAGYVGIVPLALAVLAVLAARRVQDPRLLRRRGAIRALAAVCVLGILIAGSRDTPIAQLIYLTPVLGKLRAFSRAVILVSFALAALAGIGLQYVLDATREGGVPEQLRRRLRLTAFALGLLMVAIVTIVPIMVSQFDNLHPSLAKNLSIGKPNTFVPLLLTAVAVGLLLWWARSGLRRMAILPVLVVGLDMIITIVGLHLTVSPAAFEGTPASVAFLKRDTSLYRTVTFLAEDQLEVPVARAQLALSWGLPVGIASINGFNPLQPRRYTDFLFGPEVEDVSYGILFDNRLLQPGDHRLSMLQVKYVLLQPGVEVDPGPEYTPVFADNTVTILQNTNVYPRAYFVSRVAAAHTPEHTLATVTGASFDPRSTAIVEGALDPNQLTRLAGSVDGSDATVEQVTPNRLRVLTKTGAERLLVLSEMYLPGWYATVDGRPTPIYRANYLFRGVVVPAGEHTVELVYRPWSAIVGALLSGVTAVSLLVAAATRRRRAAVDGDQQGHR